MSRTFAYAVAAALTWGVCLSVLQAAEPAAPDPIDRATLDKWSAPYRGWHYWPDHVIAADPRIPGHPAFKNTDVPCVYQLPGQTDKWYMSFIAFNGKGYSSFVAESTDLVRWTNPRMAMGFGKEGEFDFGGCVIGAFLYESYDIQAPRVLKKREGKYWTLYGCYAKQGSYEIDPGYEGVAASDDGLAWTRAKDKPILSVHDADCGNWEKHCIYQPWLVEHEGKFFNFYNAKHMPDWIEQMGGATSANLLDWTRFKTNPIVRVRPGGYDEKFCSDGKVFRASQLDELGQRAGAHRLHDPRSIHFDLSNSPAACSFDILGITRPKTPASLTSCVNIDGPVLHGLAVGRGMLAGFIVESAAGYSSGSGRPAEWLGVGPAARHCFSDRRTA